MSASANAKTSRRRRRTGVPVTFVVSPAKGSPPPRGCPERTPTRSGFKPRAKTWTYIHLARSGRPPYVGVTYGAPGLASAAPRGADLRRGGAPDGRRAVLAAQGC